MSDQPDSLPNEELSIWDHFVGKLHSWIRRDSQKPVEVVEKKPVDKASYPWLSLAAVALALIAQFSLEPSPNRTALPGTILYIISLGCLAAAVFRGEWHLPVQKPEETTAIKMVYRPELLIMGLLLAIFAFIFFGNGMFGFLNITLWLLALICLFGAFWQKAPGKKFEPKVFWENFWQNGWRLHFSRWSVVILAVIAVILFFNFYRLDSVPPEMVSDQAEKLLDINDILHGHTPVYFPRNTGRESIHFYLTAAYMALFNLDVSFLNLKVVAVFANLLTVFFIYILGKEVGNKWVGLGAAFFAGVAYWPLLFTRLALRIPYYPLFVAPVLYFMIRGLRRQNINDILLAGLFLGLGLHGYTPFRIVPILVILVIIIFILHRKARDQRVGAVFALFLMAFISLIVFIPLLRYWLANPDLFAYRAFSRLTGMEAGFQKHPLVIFLENFWKASVMFFWDNGVIWAHSVPGRPALEVVSGGLYFLGIFSLIIRYFRNRNWMDLVLLVSIPLLMMPSILSLAYPGENPSLNRTAGAVVPVFVVIGLALETFIRTLRTKFPVRWGKIAAVLAVLIMVIWSSFGNFDLVFNQYAAIYRASSWNTTEIGRVAAFFIESIGSPETTYVVGYPHWVDSRLVAINAGVAGLDFAIFPEKIIETTSDPRAKMFFLNINDTESSQLLVETFENGVLWTYDSDVENKDFVIFFVPPMQEGID